MFYWSFRTIMKLQFVLCFDQISCTTRKLNWCHSHVYNCCEPSVDMAKGMIEFNQIWSGDIEHWMYDYYHYMWVKVATASSEPMQQSHCSGQAVSWDTHWHIVQSPCPLQLLTNVSISLCVCVHKLNMAWLPWLPWLAYNHFMRSPKIVGVSMFTDRSHRATHHQELANTVARTQHCDCEE